MRWLAAAGNLVYSGVECLVLGEKSLMRGQRLHTKAEKWCLRSSGCSIFVVVDANAWIEKPAGAEARLVFILARLVLTLVGFHVLYLWLVRSPMLLPITAFHKKMWQELLSAVCVPTTMLVNCRYGEEHAVVEGKLCWRAS